MATIWDVAARAGVSKSTVSLVLNKSPLVKDETRERVEQAIRELNYVPNNNARGLVKRESKCFGVIIPRSDLHSAQNIYDFGYHTSLYAFNVMNGISSGLMNSDYGLLIEHFFDDGSGELPSLARNNRVDGVFLIGNLMQSQMVDEIVKRGIPVVVIGHHYPQVDCVTTDVPQGIYLGVRHLLEKGYRNICYLNSPVRYGSSLSRLDGLRGAFEEFGLCVTEENHIYCQHNTGEGGYLAAKLLWELAFHQFLALIFSASDLNTGQRIKAILKSMASIYMTIFLAVVLLKFYLMSSSFINSQNSLPTLVRAFILLFLAL